MEESAILEKLFKEILKEAIDSCSDMVLLDFIHKLLEQKEG